MEETKRYTRSQSNALFAWYAVNPSWKSWSRGVPIPRDGGIMHVDGPLELCRHGLHASKHPLDALSHVLYWNTNHLLARVRMWGDVVEGDNKLCATYRQILWHTPCYRACREMAWWFLRESVFRKTSKGYPGHDALLVFVRSFLKDFNHRTFWGYQPRVHKQIQEEFRRLYDRAFRESYSSLGLRPFGDLSRLFHAFYGATHRTNAIRCVVDCHVLFFRYVQKVNLENKARAHTQFFTLIHQQRQEATR